MSEEMLVGIGILAVFIAVLVLVFGPFKYKIDKEILISIITLLLLINGIPIFNFFIKKFFIKFDFDYFYIVYDGIVSILICCISKYISKIIDENQCKISFYFIDKEFSKKKIYMEQEGNCTSYLDKNIGVLTIHYCIKTENIKEKILENCNLIIKIEGTKDIRFQKSKADSNYQNLNDDATTLSIPLLKLGSEIGRVGDFQVALHEGDISEITLNVTIEKNGKPIKSSDKYSNLIIFNSNLQKINIS